MPEHQTMLFVRGTWIRVLGRGDRLAADFGPVPKKRRRVGQPSAVGPQQEQFS